MRLTLHIAFLAFFAVAAWSFFFTGARFQSSDSMETYRDARLIAAGEAPISKYPPGQVFLLLPIVMLEKWNPEHNVFARGTFWNERASNLISNFSAAAISFLMVLLLVELGLSPIAAGWLALLCSLGTILAPYGTYSFSEINLGFTLLASFYFLLLYFHNRSLRSLLFFSGLCLGYSILLKANILIVTPFFAFAIWIKNYLPEKSSSSLPIHGEGRGGVIQISCFSLPILACIYIYLLYNHWRFGSVLNFGYGQGYDGAIGFHGSLLQGLFGQLLSPGKSLFLYSPVLIISFCGWREFMHTSRIFAWLCLAALLSLLILYSKWWCWAGDWSWGPRFLAPLTPLLFLPAAFILRRLWLKRRSWRIAIAAFGFASVAFQVAPSSVEISNFTAMNTSSRLFTESKDGKNIVDYLAIEHYVPSSSPILGIPWLFARSLDTLWHIRNNQFGHFSVRWKGEICLPNEPRAMMRANCGGSVKVKIDDKKIIDQKGASGPTSPIPLENLGKGWHAIQVDYAYEKEKPFLSLETASASSPDFKPIPASQFRNGKGANGLAKTEGLKAKYYISSIFKRKWREQIDPMLCFDWQRDTPFQQWIREGFPPNCLYYGTKPPQPNFQRWMFVLNSWPAAFFYSEDLRENTSAWIAFVITAAIFFGAIGGLMVLMRRAKNWGEI